MSRFCRSLGPVSLQALEGTNAPKAHRRCILFLREERDSPLGGFAWGGSPGELYDALALPPAEQKCGHRPSSNNQSDYLFNIAAATSPAE